MVDDIEVSIIIANYNNSDYLEKSFNQISSQTHPNFEVIIIDDASTDDSVEFIKNYLCKDDRFSLYENETNVGVSASLNRAISIVKNKYILRHDPDDYLVEDAIRILLNRMRESNADIVSGQALAFGSQCGLTSWPLTDFEIKKNLLIESAIHQPCALVKRNVFENLKYRTLPSEDYDLWLRSAAMNFTFSNSPELITHYRRHQNNLTSVNKDEIFYSHIPMLRREALSILETNVDRYHVDIFSRALDKQGLSKLELSRLSNAFEEIYPDYHSYSKSLKASIYYYWYKIHIAHAKYGLFNFSKFTSRYKDESSVLDVVSVFLVSLLRISFESYVYKKLNRVRHYIRSVLT